MALLSENEASAFQSFLSSVHVDQSVRDNQLSQEWSLYPDPSGNSYDEGQREHLARATKDLLALNPPQPNNHDIIQNSAGYHSPRDPHSRPNSSRGHPQEFYGGGPGGYDRSRDNYDPFPPFQRGEAQQQYGSPQQYPPPIFTHNINSSHLGPPSSQASSPPSSIFSSMSSGSTPMTAASYNSRTPFGGHGPQYQNQHMHQHDHGFLLPSSNQQQRSPQFSPHSHSPIRSPHPMRASPPEHHLNASPQQQNSKRPNPHSDQHDPSSKRHRGHSMSEENGNSSLMASTMALTQRSDDGGNRLKHEDMGPPLIPVGRLTRSSARLNKGSSDQHQAPSSNQRRATVPNIQAPVPAPPAAPLPRRDSTAGPSAVDSPSFATLSTFKPTLLSPSQKKANHIQSEQKRRANIRRGYEALCECVPVLREACREEDEMNARHDPADGPMKARSRAKKGGRKGIGGNLNSVLASDDGEKLDGRAGPRSENIVLGKTIDYITELKAEHETLLERLDRARKALGPRHPQLHVPSLHLNPGKPRPIPLWEREWTGGEGRSGEDDDDDE